MSILSVPPWQLLGVVIAVMSLFLFGMMGVDKGKARRGAWRISEKTLFVFALLFGAPGGTLGMRLFRHKTKHWYFRIGFPVLAALQLALWFYLMLKR